MVFHKKLCTTFNFFQPVVVTLQLYGSLMRDHDLGRKFLDVVSARKGVEKLGGMSDTSAEGTTHSVLIEEQVAFANWINWY